MPLRARRWLPSRTIALLAPLALILASCGLAETTEPRAVETAPSGSNLLINPGFELGQASWNPGDTALVAPYVIADGTAHTGSRSVELSLAALPSGGAATTALASQTLIPNTFPEFVSGFYRVDDWATGARLQFVVTVTGGDFGDGPAPHEVRFVLGGAPPPEPEDAGIAYVFIDRGEPETGRWVPFGYPIKQAFQSRLGKVPTVWQSIRLSLELRGAGGDADAEAPPGVAYFDDLYAGPQIAAPLPPEDD